MDNKKLYIEYYDANREKLSLFHQPWWLDAVCGRENWDVCLETRDNRVLAYMPYYTTRKYGFRFLSMPPLTPYLGPEMADQISGQDISPGDTKKIYTSLVSQLPDFDFFNQSFRPEVTNWMPFHWSGFRQTTRYTYCFSNDLEIETIWNNFEGRVRNDIRKASDNYNLEVTETDDIGKLCEINKNSQKDNPYDARLLEKLDKIVSENKKRKIMLAVDSAGSVCSAIYIVWDARCVYYLVGLNDPTFGNTGANSLLLWEAIKFSLQGKKNFDFEGSMLFNIEKYFRGFNARLTPYNRVYRANSFLLRLYLVTRSGF